MRLLRLLVTDLGPFGRLELNLQDALGQPRQLAVIHGGPGVGKTTLLAAIAHTRPGYAVTPHPSLVRASGQVSVECEYLLGDDDPERPHPLCVVSPGGRGGGRALDERESLRRREQAHFDQVARDGGFVALSFPATRWFSRQPVQLSAPLRSVARYDVRGATNFDDASRSDLTRETKQALAYAEIHGLLAGRSTQSARLSEVMRTVVGRLCEPFGFTYLGIHELSFEAQFSDGQGEAIPFDFLPTRVREAVALGALVTRALWAGHLGRDPSEAEGIFLIDDIELHQAAETAGALISILRRCLPRSQWIVTTASNAVAALCEKGEVFALRQSAQRAGVELFVEDAATTH